MPAQGLNLFIVDDNKSLVTALKQYLQNKFGFSLNISTFNDGESCLQKLKDDTHIVILDHYMEGKNGVEVLKSIKSINPNTEVIMLSNHADMAIAVESFRAGAIDYVVKGPTSWNKITKHINYIITAPIRLIVKEFRVSKYMAIFMLTFLTMAVVVVTALHFLK
ncbi:MAG TPA: response regulator [Bacteroidia bacterium]|nr:response regulator [Bacteroidia bacterium]